MPPSVEVGWPRPPGSTPPGIDGAAEDVLDGFDAVWIAPASPYRSMRGALEAITFARSHDLPLLGTCGGFQHVVIEFARNVAGIPDAAHAEYDPTTSRLLINGGDAVRPADLQHTRGAAPAGQRLPRGDPSKAS